MQYLLDSDVIINFVDQGHDFPTGLKITKQFISVITYYEIMFGAKKQNKANIFTSFIKDFDLHVLELSQNIATRAIDLRIQLEEKGTRIDSMDLFIAATAIENDLMIVTNNTKHFAHLPKVSLY